VAGFEVFFEHLFTDVHGRDWSLNTTRRSAAGAPRLCIGRASACGLSCRQSIHRIVKDRWRQTDFSIMRMRSESKCLRDFPRFALVSIARDQLRQACLQLNAPNETPLRLDPERP
jgi:hypothetical protein